MQQERIEIQLPSRLWYIEPVLSLLKQLAQQLGFCQQRVADIQLAIDEICGNAIEHGSAGDDTGIAISFVLNEHQLDILVRDKGTDNKGNWLTAEKLNEIYQKRAPDRETGTWNLHGRTTIGRTENGTQLIWGNGCSSYLQPFKRLTAFAEHRSFQHIIPLESK